MGENRLNRVETIITGVLVFFAFWLHPSPVAPSGIQSIEGIDLDEQSETLTIRTGGRVPIRLFQVGEKELVIALKDVKLQKKASKDGIESRLVKRIETEALPGNIVVLNVYLSGPAKAARSEWTDGGKAVRVRLLSDAPPKRSPPPSSKAPPQPLPETAPQPEAKAASDIRFPEWSIDTLEALERKGRDSIDFLLEGLGGDGCISHPEIRRAAAGCRAQSYQEVYRDMERYVNSEPAGDCLDAAYFLRAYAYYKNRNSNSEDQNRKAASLFQEAVGYYPESRYAPAGITAMGKLHRSFKDYDQAKGYLRAVLDRYPDFPGASEVMLELGRLLAEQEKTGLAVSTLQSLIARHPKSALIPEAKLELGKAFFEENRFQEALDLFTSLSGSYPGIVFESPDLLVSLGNAYYQMGKMTEARDVLLRAVNCFPQMPASDTALTRIADTLREEKQAEKAQKLYEHVVKSFPGSDGYIISSVRMAEYLKRAPEKENLYRMIINDFPDHPLTQLAYIKLANLLNKEGDYEKSIDTIHTFLAKYPGSLKDEAVQVMEEVYGSLFKRLLRADDTAGVLTWYERDKPILNRMNQPEIFAMVGRAYLSGHLHAEAAELLQKAFQLLPKEKQAPDLIFNLGVALQEAGQEDPALAKLEAYCRQHPGGDRFGEALSRIGRMLMGKKQYERARKTLQQAFQHAGASADKAAIRILEAEADKALGDYKPAARNLIQAIDFFSADPQQSNGAISKLYRDLGDIYLETKTYLKAADSFAMAIKFSDRTENPDLRFLLAETYEKGEAVEMADRVYREIVESGDPFWARLAQEKLRGIQINNRLAPKRESEG